jgi:chromosome segregation ATPase
MGELAVLREKEANWMREVAALRADCEGKREEIGRVNNAKTALEADKLALQAEIFTISLFKSDLEAQLSHIQKDHEASISTLQASLSQKITENNDLNTEVQGLIQQLDTLSARLFVREQETTTLREVERKMAASFDKLQEEEMAVITKLKSEEYRSKVLEGKCAELEGRLLEQQDKFDLKPWETKVKELQYRLSDQVAATKLAEDRLAAALREYEEERRGLEGRIKAMTMQMIEDGKQTEELVVRVRKQEKELVEMKLDAENREKAVENMEKAVENAEKLLKQANDDKFALITQSDLLKQQIIELESLQKLHLQQFSDLQRELNLSKDSQNRDNGLKIKLKACEASLEELQLKLHKERSEKKQLQSEIAHLSAANANTDTANSTDLHEYRAKVAFLEIELATSKQNIENATARIQQLQTQIESLNSENARLQAETTLANNDMAIIGPLRIQLQLQAKQMMAVREDLERGVGLLETATESLEGNTTCYSCLELLKEAVLCLPCGHVFCQKCKEKTRGCSECGPVKVVSSVIRVGLIDTISGKVSYSRQVINSMRGTLTRLQELV